MSEVAPGLYTSPFVKPGTMLEMKPHLIMAHPVFPHRAVAVHPDDWQRIPGAERERILDDLTRGDAVRGQAAIERFLCEGDSEATHDD